MADRRHGAGNVWAALDAASARARMVVVEGPAGIGKRRLLEAFAATRGASLTVSALPQDRGVPYATKARALRTILRERPTLAPEGWHRYELARLLPDLFDGPAWQQPIRDDHAELRLLEATASVLQGAIAGKATLLAADLQFWDAASFGAARHFLAQLEGSAVRALASFSPGPGALARHRHLRALVSSGLAEVVTLKPVDAARVWRLAGAAYADGGASPPSDASAGGPVSRLWALSRAAPPAGSAGRPASLLESWVDALPAEATGLLCVRALSGEAYDAPLAEAALGLTPSRVAAAGRELERHGLAPEDEPVHELVAAAALRRAPREALRSWQGRLADALADAGAHPAHLAALYLGAWRPSAAYPHLLRAGDAAAALYGVDDARRWYLKGLWAAPDERSRAEALLRLHDLRRPADATAFEEAVEAELAGACDVLDDAGLTLQCRLRRAQSSIRHGRLDAAREAGENALTLALERGDAAAAVRARLALAEAAHRSGRPRVARDHLLAVTDTAVGGARLEALQRLAWLEETTGDLATALQGHRRALAVARELADLPAEARLLTRVGAAEERLGDYQASIRSLLEAAEVAARCGDRQVEGIALADAAISYTDAGRLDVAYRTASRATEVTEPLGLDRSSALAHFVQGYVLRRLGRWREARVDLDEALRLRNASGDPRGALVARFNLAASALEGAQAAGRSGDHAPALAVIDELSAMHVDEFVAWCHLELAFLTSDAEVARGYLERVGEPDRGGRLALAFDTARLRAALLAGNAAAVRTRARALAQRAGGSTWLETSLAHLLLSRAAADAPERRRHRLRALRRIVTEVGDLGTSAARSRLAYLTARVPAGRPRK